MVKSDRAPTPVRQRASRRSRVRASPRVVRFWLECFRFWLGFVCQNHSNTSHIGFLRVRAGRRHNISSSACFPPLSFSCFLGVFRSFGTAPVLLASFGVRCAESCWLTTVPEKIISKQKRTNERQHVGNFVLWSTHAMRCHSLQLHRVCFPCYVLSMHVAEGQHVKDVLSAA
jgi:hypothetical protein